MTGSTGNPRQLKLPLGYPVRDKGVKLPGTEQGPRSLAAPPPEEPDENGEPLPEEYQKRAI